MATLGSSVRTKCAGCIAANIQSDHHDHIGSPLNIEELCAKYIMSELLAIIVEPFSFRGLYSKG